VIYLLSILDGLDGALGGLVFASVVGLLGAVVAPAFLHSMAFNREDSEAAERSAVQIRPWRARCAVAMVVFTLVAAAVPSTESLLRAYVMVEGSKIVHAENAEAASKALLERVDKLIAAVADE
jgi:hypothetical protein